MNKLSILHNCSETFTRFQNGEEAWFWYCRGQQLRESGQKFERTSYMIERPCHLDDIIRIVMKLRFSGKLKSHIDILMHYGQRFYVPDARLSEEKEDFYLWDHAITQIESILEQKGLLENDSVL
ncbi:MAG: hypothetical protein JXR30_03265 [Alphaproteobacteria bacterium]|nr:hypothetical protein [Alphaproteobacteria bacterium]